MATEAFVSGNYATKAEAQNFNGIVKSYTNGTSGYVKFSTGLLVQWGRSSASRWTYFPTSFSNTNYAITMSINNWAGATSPVGAQSLRNNCFYGTNEGYTDPFFYIAIWY